MRPLPFHRITRQLFTSLEIAGRRGRPLCSASSVLSSTIRCTQNLPPYVDPQFSYAFGRSTQHLSDRPFSAFFEDRLQTSPDKLAIISQHENLKITSQQFYNDVHSLAYGIYHELGIRRGDVVCLWSCNSYRWMQVQYACNLIGAILCTVNPAYQAPELLYAIQTARAKAIFLPGTDSAQNTVNQFFRMLSHSNVSNALRENSCLQSIVVLDQHDGSGIQGFKTYEFDQLCPNDKLSSTILNEVQPDDPSLIMYTSGTTGKPKGAVLSHFTLINNALLSGTRMVSNEDKIICMPLPLFHAFAYVAGSVMMLVLDGTLVLSGYRYASKEVLDSINQHNCNMLFATPTIIIDMMNYARKHKVSIQSLKFITSGGASMPIEIANQISTIFPSVDDFRIGYGATETGPVATCLFKEDPVEKKVQTVGKPIDFIELKVVEPKTLRVLPLGEKGELLVRGHNLMLGYLDNETATKEAITQSRWYRTGDIATMDNEGYVRICGRTKEMIIRGGENVYPLEVEQVLHQHPNILDAYVIGIPDKRVGEEICAWVKLKDSKTATTEQDIRDFCRDKITYFKIPRRIIFVDGFPLTPAGKAKKFIMVEETCRRFGIEYQR